MPLFKLPGGLLALDAADALMRGEVQVKSRWRGKTLLVDESPAGSWNAAAACGPQVSELLTMS